MEYNFIQSSQKGNLTLRTKPYMCDILFQMK